MQRSSRVVSLIAFLAGAAAWAAGGSADATTAQTPAPVEVVLVGENNRLNAYDAATGAKHTVIPSAADAPGIGLDINAEICFVPDGVPWKPAGEIWFIAGEDTEQNADPGVIKQGWGVFRLTGTTLETLQAEELGKFVPDSFVTTPNSNPENYGCGVLPDGRVVTGDVGDQLPMEPATGQLIVWFPAAEHFTGSIGPDRNDFRRVPHCKIDVEIGTSGGIEVDGTDVYIASNRPDLPDPEEPVPQLGGIYRYDSTAWPTGEAPADGCSRVDDTGEQLAAEDRVGKELFIPQGISLTPSDIVDSGRGTFYVSSVFTGQVAEYGRDGLFRRFVVLTLGQLGGITPFGLGVTTDGTLWIADIGIVGPGPALGEGSVVRVRFDAAGNPGPLETIDEGLEFPDGVGTVVLSAAPAPALPPVGAADEAAGGAGAVARGGGGEALPATGSSVPFAWPAALAVIVALAVRRASGQKGRSFGSPAGGSARP